MQPQMNAMTREEKRRAHGDIKTSRAPDRSEKERFEGFTAAIFSRLGMNLDSPGTRDTPQRNGCRPYGI